MTQEYPLKNGKMKKKHLCLLVLLAYFHQSYAQSKHTLFLNTGYAFNDDIELKESLIQKSQGYNIDLGFTYRFFTHKQWASEIGLSGKTIFATGSLSENTFRATTFRITAPLKFTYRLPRTNFAITSGFIFQNNVDFTEFDFRLRDKYAWRVNYLLELRYALNTQVNLTLAWHSNLRNIPNPYFINDPKMAIIIGVTKAIFFNKNKKKKP